MKKIFLGFGVTMVILFVISCGNNLMEPDYYSYKSTEGFMVTDKSVFSIGAATSDTTVKFTSNMWWKITVTDAEGKTVNWIDVSPKSGRGNVEFSIKSDSNYVMEVRDALVKISPDGESDFNPVVFTIRQNASKPFINFEGVEIAGDSMFIGIVGANSEIKVHANMVWRINTTNAPWFSFSPASGGGRNNVDKITGSYSSNSSGGFRVGKIVFEGDKLSRTLVVKQKDQFDKAKLSVDNDHTLTAHWTPVIGVASYNLVFTDKNDAPINIIGNIDKKLLEYNLTDYFSSISYSGVVKVVLKAISTDPTIFSESNKVLSHSHFANGSGDGSEGNEYLIANMRHLNNINASGELNKHYKQVVDLDFTGVVQYIPIGQKADQPFTGTYTGLKAGGGKYLVINRNYSVDNPSVSFFGMFGIIGSGAVISDLRFENCKLDMKQATAAAPSGFAHAVGVNFGGTVKNIEVDNCEILLSTFTTGTGIGGIVGNNGNGTSTTGLVENCKTTGGRIFSSSTSNSSQSYFVGGIVGVGALGSVVNNCSNISTPVTSRGSTGGIAGKDGTVTNSYNRADLIGATNTGGIIAIMTTADKVEKCYNTGNLIYRYGQAGYYFGGIAGRINVASGTAKVTECFNSGNITAEITNRPSMFGGIVGQVTSAEILNCYNTGNVVLACTDATKAAFAGGIIGNIGADPRTLLANCYVTGTVGDGGVSSVAGERCAIVGNRNSTIPVIRNTYYLTGSALKALGGNDQTTNATDVSSKSESELGSVATYNVSWNFTDIWSSPFGSYPYPQLKSVPHVEGNK